MSPLPGAQLLIRKGSGTGREHAATNFADGVHRVETFRTHPGAVADIAAAVEAKVIVEIFQTQARGGIATVDDKALCLQQRSRAEIFFGIPPPRGASRGAARAQ